ncbi:MAG: thermonuclease family protein [Parvibaculum sp.]|nr:thermonuclease family protein [Parvibaculum sp.]
MGRIVPFESRYQRRARRAPHNKQQWFSSLRVRALFFRCAVAAAALALALLILDRERQPITSVEWAAHSRDLPDHRSIFVYDGDTILLGQERIRIVGLDTPELGHLARCREEGVAAERAKQALIGEIARGNVALDRQGIDRYGRTLARVTVDGRDVASTLIANGLARPYSGGRRDGWCG